MAAETPQNSKRLSSLKQAAPEWQKAIAVAAGLIIPIVIFIFLIAARLPNASQSVVATGDAVLMYTERLPFRTKPDASMEVIYYMPLPTDPQTGQQKNTGYLTQEDLGGVRITSDGSTWIVLVIREEVVYQEYYADDKNIREEFYVPTSYFKLAPGAGKPPFLRNIDL